MKNEMDEMEIEIWRAAAKAGIEFLEKKFPPKIGTFRITETGSVLPDPNEHIFSLTYTSDSLKKRIDVSYHTQAKQFVCEVRDELELEKDPYSDPECIEAFKDKLCVIDFINTYGYTLN